MHISFWLAMYGWVSSLYQPRVGCDSQKLLILGKCVLEVSWTKMNMSSLYKESLAALGSEQVCFWLFCPTVTLKSNRKCSSLDHFLFSCVQEVWLWHGLWAHVWQSTGSCSKSKDTSIHCYHSLGKSKQWNLGFSSLLFWQTYARFPCGLLTPQPFTVCAYKQAHGVNYEDYFIPSN